MNANNISKIFLLILFITSCSGKQIVSGNLPDLQRLSLLEIGKDNKKSVENMLGSPSFRGALGDNSYYYIGTLSSKFAFLKQKVDKQYIIELKFNKKSLLKDVYFYDKSKSIDVAMSNMQTSIYGVKKSFFRNLIDNFGLGAGGLRRGGPIIGSGKADD